LPKGCKATVKGRQKKVMQLTHSGKHPGRKANATLPLTGWHCGTGEPAKGGTGKAANEVGRVG